MNVKIYRKSIIRELFKNYSNIYTRVFNNKLNLSLLRMDLQTFWESLKLLTNLEVTNRLVVMMKKSLGMIQLKLEQYRTHMTLRHL